MYFQKLMALCVTMVLVGCGGESGGSSTEPLKNETPKDTTVTILDTYRIIGETENTFYGESRESGRQKASFFNIDSPMQLTDIKWIGLAIDAGESSQATFILRIYDGDNIPNITPINERIEVVDMNLVLPIKRHKDKRLYAFSFADEPIFVLPQGRYWLSIVDPETESIEFTWEVEPGTTSGFEGSGGAYKGSTDTTWKTNGNGVAAPESRGHNLQILGVSN